MDTEPEKSPSERVLRTRRLLVQAVTREFARKGYAGATTRAIASAAGVSELTLFRHFNTKKELFLAVLGRHSPLQGLQTALERQMNGDLRHDLLVIGNQFLRAVLERREVILMTLRETDRLPDLRDITAQVPLLERRLLTGYLSGQIERGAMRPMDPELAAQAFLGIFFSYAVSRALLGQEPDQPPDRIADLFVDIFLKGILPG